ncbi:hypothetical protein LTV02_16545 [Nocardia yamanashiensis]|uniref:hypothetical protein n=1 Tax=Nocardia yamanashiensis TaxID=209247 RepID=UPI001E4150BB|nr:hypothetical protein [Nocardia yamanashiensis]UGT44905.1 hypothetical protein LTV02_16545 [Nocardia yamanashiensis]
MAILPQSSAARLAPLHWTALAAPLEWELCLAVPLANPTPAAAAFTEALLDEYRLTGSLPRGGGPPELPDAGPTG